MSLISDALRKARQEAAQRDAIERDAVAPLAMTVSSARSRWQAGLVVGAVIALVAAAVGASAVWWAMGNGGQAADENPAAGSASAAEAGGPIPPRVQTSGAQDVTPEQPRARDDEGAHAPQAELQPAAAEDLDPVPATQPQPASAASEAVPESKAHPAPAAPRRDRPAGAEEERVFVIDADLGTVVLSLDYIVFRASDPFAEINGVEVHEGSTIEGFVVEQIERGQIRLRDADGPLLLRVR